MDSRASCLYFRLVLCLLLLKYSSGCQDEALGVEDANKIPDNRITASSEYSSTYGSTKGRLNASPGWAPSGSDQSPYLQIDLGHAFLICAIGTQGREDGDEWVTTYKIRLSMDNQNWNTYQENGVDKVFNGNTDRNTEVKRILAVLIIARYIRFKPLTSNGDKVMRVEVYGERPATACEDSALGMEDSRIPNDNITASSNSTSAGRARLGTSGSWCASTGDVKPYLQVDLGTSHVICALATQGNPTADQWVQTYTVMTSSNGVNWTLYLENNKTRTFYGNYDQSSVVRQILYKSPIARYFRIIPVRYRGERCLRIELYGSAIAPGCRTRSTGIPSRKLIPDHRFTATSYYSTSYYPWYGRLNSKKYGWAATNADRGSNRPYLQVDVGSLYHVCAVLTQGMSTSDAERVKQYRISYSMDNIAWVNYTEGGLVKVFTGNVDNSKVVTNYFTVPILGKFFRFYPTLYHNYPSVRLDYNGLASGCASSLGVEGGLVLDSQLSSSSHSDNSHTASAGRLYGGSSWCSSSSPNNEFLQIDLGKVKTVTGIATQGDPTEDKWVTQFSIKYGFTGTDWNAFKDGQQNIKTFPGNSGRGTGRVTWFSVPFAGRYIRVNPTAHHGAVCMRVDLYGCGFVFSPSSQSTQVTLNPKKGTTLSLTCAKGYPQPGITWYKNGSKVDGQTTNNIDIRFTSASEVMTAYKCQRTDLTKRAVKCTLSYACTAAYPLTIPSAAPAQSSHVVYVPLNVLAAPSVSGDPKKRSVTLSLSVTPSDDTGVLTGYTVYYQPQGESAQTIDVAAVSPYELDKLKPYTKYTVKARGTSVVGKGLWSTAIAYTTRMAAPEGKMIISNNRVESSTRISIWWKKSSDYVLNGAFKDYLIEYTAQNGRTDSVSVNDQKSSSRLLISLNEFTRYTIAISARNTHYKGATSDSISVKTPEDAPVCSPILKLTALSSTSIRVTWYPLVGTCVNGILRGYNISYTKSDENAPKVIDIDPSLMTTDIDGLNKYTEYKVKVRGFTIRPGPFSKEEHIKTKPDCPETKPTLTKVEAVSSTSVVVNWQFTDHSKLYGDLKGYQIKYQPKGGAALYENVSDTSAGSFTINGLGKFTMYDVAISVMNQVCIGPFSPSQEEQTLQDAPDAPPDSLKFITINATTFNISWLPVPQQLLNGIIREYELDVKISSNGTSRVRKRRALTASTYKTQANYYILYGLLSCSNYTLKVRAYTNDPEPGPYTSPKTLLTSRPGPPAELKSEKLPERSIKLTWELPRGFEGRGEHFTIALKGNKSYWPSFGTDVREYTAKWSQRSQVFDGLIPGTEYFIDISSTTNCGTSKKTSAKEQTEIVAPLPPSVGDISKTTNITLWTANQTNGPINWYQIIVYREKSENKNLTDSEAKNLDDYRTAEEKGLHYYITAELPASSMGTDRWMIVGEGDTFPGWKKTFDNVQLDESQKFKIYIRAMTYTSSKPLAGEVALAAIVPATPTVKKETVSTPPPAGVIAGAVVAVLIVVLVIVVIGLLYKRRQSEKSRDNKSDVRLDELDNREQEALETHPQPPAGRKNHVCSLNRRGGSRNFRRGDDNEAIYDETLDNPCKPIPITQFPEYVTKMKSNEYAALHEEYKKFENGQQFPWDVARKPENKKKNRYANIVAYDHSRVVLELIDGDNNSDYVNASFLRGYDGKPKAYIASQGPVPPAFEGFWRMIWEQNTSSIIMLTNLVELGKTKCHQYWPEDRDTYGPVTVNCHKTEVFADYAIKTFIISRAGTKETRYVRQFHFTVWPDKGVPRYATAVLGFRRKVNAMTPGNAGPVVVHCSAGVGRTGAYIVIDAMLERAKKLRNIDINNYVVSIRKDRPHMVQTSEQYVFIHLAVLEALSCGNTEIASQNLAIALNKLEAVDQRRQLSGYASEFQRLNYVTSDQTTDEDTSIGQSSENVDKNRDPDIVALNRCRVILHKYHASEHDYINATFIDAHRDRNAFILTPAPMENTMEDFWRMITDYNIGTIVMLNNLQEGDQSFPRYWPDEGSVTYGDTIVTLIDSQSNMDFLSSKLRVSRKSKTMDVTHLQHQSWSDKCIPARAQSVLSLHDELQISQQRTGNAPVVVQCSNGVGRSGTFCAIASLIERLKEEHVIDVFQTIKRIRVSRPGAVEGLTQYVFCYQMVKRYLDSFDDYANFGDR